jgi:hypothetical protein
VLGFKLGAKEGDELGFELGLTDGIELGFKEGWLVGEVEGLAVGFSVGFFVGEVEVGVAVEGHSSNTSATVSTLHVLPRALSAKIVSSSA